MRIAIIVLLIAALSCMGFMLNKVTRADVSDNIPRLQLSTVTTPIDVSTCLQKKEDSSWEWSGDKYLDRLPAPGIGDVKYALAAMDRVTHDTIFNRRTLSATLTQERVKRMAGALGRYTPDSLLALIQWAEQFQYYAAFDPADQIFYQSVFGYWLNIVATSLTTASEQTPRIRHDFKFKYLMTRCKEKNYTIGVKVTSFDKFIENILYGNYGHLVHSTWNQSSWVLKLLFLLVGILLVLGSTTAIKYLRTLIKR